MIEYFPEPSELPIFQGKKLKKFTLNFKHYGNFSIGVNTNRMSQ